MATFTIKDRREIWLFSEIEKISGERVYRRLKFNLVKYGNDPEENLEPVNEANFTDPITGDPIGFLSATGVGRMSEIRLIQGRYSQFHAFDDFDAASNSGN